MNIPHIKATVFFLKLLGDNTTWGAKLVCDDLFFFHFAKQFFLRSGLPWLLMLLLVWFGCLFSLVGLYCIVVCCVFYCLLYCENTESKAYILYISESCFAL